MIQLTSIEKIDLNDLGMDCNLNHLFKWQIWHGFWEDSLLFCRRVCMRSLQSTWQLFVCRSLSKLHCWYQWLRHQTIKWLLFWSVELDTSQTCWPRLSGWPQVASGGESPELAAMTRTSTRTTTTRTTTTTTGTPTTERRVLVASKQMSAQFTRHSNQTQLGKIKSGL